MSSASRLKRMTVVIAITIAVMVLTAIGVVVYSQLMSGAATVISAPAAAAAVVAPATAQALQRVSTVDGLTVIALNAATQVQSGIRVDTLLAAVHQTELVAYGTAIDLQPLIDLRTRYAMAQAETEVTTASLASSRQEYQRNRALYQDSQNTSLKALQMAQATFLGDQAKLNAAATNARNIRGSVQQQFGDLLSRWALDPHSRQFERLLNRQEVLLRFTLPLGEKLQAPANIAITSDLGQRLPAALVSPATQSDALLQGSAFIYRTAAPIPVGSNIVAYLPTSSLATQGVFIPANAIVWYGGQPWAYVQVQAERFARRPVNQQSPANGGFFVSNGIKPGERVVVSGAQLLLSEELRPPPSSSGCKDPECD